jgi:hypothetical protein
MMSLGVLMQVLNSVEGVGYRSLDIVRVIAG